MHAFARDAVYVAPTALSAIVLGSFVDAMGPITDALPAVANTGMCSKP